jgi:hypothetical protein
MCQSQSNTTVAVSALSLGWTDSMLSLSELAGRIADLSLGRVAPCEFAVWFRRASANVHIWGTENIQDVVSSVESVLSEYHFADLSEDDVAKELVAAIRLLVPESAQNSYGDSPFIILESNAEAYSNAVAA